MVITNNMTSNDVLEEASHGQLDMREMTRTYGWDAQNLESNSLQANRTTWPQSPSSMSGKRKTNLFSIYETIQKDC